VVSTRSVRFCVVTRFIREDFALKHSSTFAGNTLGCRIGLAVLDILTRDNGALLAEIAEKGALLKDMLSETAAKYPPDYRPYTGPRIDAGH